jgi:DNA invertase Pin-like site-specific DNA recombinase
MLVGYARVSTQDQKPELQLDALKAAGCEKVFVEKASGAQRERPELKAALDYMRDGDTLVVWKLDRLARSMKQLIETVEGLEEVGVGFRSLTEAIDTTTAGGKLVFHVFGALAEFERSIIRERTRAGLDAARARGRKGGRPPKLKEDDLRAARAMLADGEITVEAVAKRLDVSPATLYRHLPAARAQTSSKTK